MQVGACRTPPPDARAAYMAYTEALTQAGLCG